MKTLIDNNKATVIGTISSAFTYSHEIFGEKFYMVDVEVERLSGTFDNIPVTISERLIDIKQNYKGSLISVTGQFRSYNRHEENRTRLILSVFAVEIEFLEGLVVGSDSNCICLEGFICKEPVYRKTPLGREIADLLIAVNRPYGKSDYIPCICWGRNARFAGGLKLGNRIWVEGRIQSREYTKRIDYEGNTKKRTAYEVSISKMEVREDEKESN